MQALATVLMSEYNLNLNQVLFNLIFKTYFLKTTSDYEKEVQQTIQYVTLQHLLNLVASDESIPQVKAIVYDNLDKLIKEFKGTKTDFSKSIITGNFRVQKGPFKI